MPGPLIIPGPGGDDLLDVNAAAEFLGVRVSTLRNHQYQDGRRGAAEPWPQPEDPDAMQIALPGGAGIEWARAIEELLYRSGGAGRPVTLWRRSILAAFKAERQGAAVPLRDGAEGPVIGEAVLHGDGTFTATVTDPDAVARLQPSLKPGDISFEGGSIASMDGPWAELARRGSMVARAFVEQDAVIEASREEGVKRLTATEVLERARLRREGKL